MTNTLNSIARKGVFVFAIYTATAREEGRGRHKETPLLFLLDIASTHTRVYLRMPSLFREVVISSSSNDSHHYIWDLHSGAILGTLKGNQSSRNSVTQIGTPMACSAMNAFRSSWLLAVQITGQNSASSSVGSAILHLWSFQKV